MWGIYTIALVMFQILMVSAWDQPSENAFFAASILSGMVVPNLLYAGVCAMVLFSDLYVPRMCNALHAMPMRREGWFLTHTAAGLLFGLIPNAAAALVLLPGLREYGYMAGIWLGVMLLEFLCFFGIGALSAVCAGSRLGMAAIYAILNGFSLLGYAVAEILCKPLLYGVVIPTGLAKFLCPVAQIASVPLLSTSYDHPMGAFVIDRFDPFGWRYLLGMAVLGVVLTALAVIIYRRRQLERAGDFLAVQPLVPVFLVIATVSAGLIFYLFSELTMEKGSYPVLFVGMAVGWFVGKMLLERRIQVFGLRNLAGFLLAALVMAGGLTLTWLDVLGLTEKIPEEDRIEFCSMDVYPRVYPKRVTDPEQIHQIRKIHEALIQAEPMNAGGPLERNERKVFVRYHLTDGTDLEREYWIDSHDPLGRSIARYLSRWENLLEAESQSEFENRVIYASADLYEDGWDTMQNVVLNREQVHRVVTEVIRACDAGILMNDIFQEDSVAAVQFHVLLPQIDDGYDYSPEIYLPIPEECEALLQVLREIRQENSGSVR